MSRPRAAKHEETLLGSQAVTVFVTRLARRAIASAATRIDPARRLVHVADGPAVPFDLLSILAFERRLVMRLRDRIDRRLMALFTTPALRR